MRNTIGAIIFLLAATGLNAQNLRKMSVFKTPQFDSRASITVESMSYDPLIAGSALRSALLMQGFKVISERVAQEKVELANKVTYNDSSFTQNISAGNTTYIKSVYVVTMNYQIRADLGCGGQVMSAMSGQIIDLANDGQIVASFSFKQSSFEGKCADHIMQVLAARLKND
jgi:hypothetical protein